MLPFNSPCGSPACIDIYTAGPDNVWPSGHDGAGDCINHVDLDNDDDDINIVSPDKVYSSDDIDKLTLWTRAFFEVKFIIDIRTNQQ